MKFYALAVAAALVGTAASAKDKRTFAVLRFTNKQLTKGRVDPIVTPGKESTHVHSVFGGSNFGISSTGKDLMNSKCSSAMIGGDNSNYWVPSLYFKDPKTGKFEDVELFYANAYYFFEPTNDEIKAFPVGLSMLVGDPKARAPPKGGEKGNLDPSKGPVSPVKWTCPRSNFNPPSWPAGSDGSMAGIGDPNNKGEGVGFPDQNCDGYASPLRGDIHFPSCYNPAAGLTNYKENTVFPSDAGNGKADCPKGWIHMPHLFLEVYWNTPLFKDRWTPGQGHQPFVLSNGDATGYSNHADFMAGWDEEVLQKIIDTCDAGSSGMDKCPVLLKGLNKGDCTIDNPVKEVVNGVLSALPGDNPVTGWQYGSGDNGGPKPSESSGGQSTVKPTSTKPAGGNNTPVSSNTLSTREGKPTSTKLPSSSSSTPISKPNPTSQVGGSEPSQCTPKTHTVYETVTVTAPTPGATDGPSSNSTETVGGYKYAGCFKDSAARALTGDILPNLGAMSNEKCVTHCKSRGFALAGTEYGGQCYCGNELVGSQKLAESACSVACEGDKSGVCGGGWALSVYSKDGEASLKGAKGR